METAEYCVELESDGDCDSTDCALIEFIPVFDENEDILQDITLNTCSPFNCSAEFNLRLNDEKILENITTSFFD